MTSARPRIVVSKCLEFEHCRYDGEIIANSAVRMMKPLVEFLPVCPEVEIGLGVPRAPIHVARGRGGLHLVQPASGLDLTRKMTRFCARFLSPLPDTDGFILKSRSPSCGLRKVRVFSLKTGSRSLSPGSGVFAAAILERFPDAAVEDERRILDFSRRDHFLTRVFTAARFRAVRNDGKPDRLLQFQAEHEFLLMAYNQTEARAMRRLAVNLKRRSIDETLDEYGRHLAIALVRPPRRAAMVNVLMCALGCLKTRLGAKERSRFLKSLEDYRAGRTPIGAPMSIIQSCVVRFGEEHLAHQVFFAPYPPELTPIPGSGRERSSQEKQGSGAGRSE